ncbi:hypothetical protein SPFM9_00254 [Salmonella phage SPFM9]|nr:hypothetical protein SPFM9_00254 [Salmonella phage SPFM9]
MTTAMGAMHGRETVAACASAHKAEEPRAIAADISCKVVRLRRPILCQQGHVDCCDAMINGKVTQLTEEYLKTQFAKLTHALVINQYNYKRYVGMKVRIIQMIFQNHKIVPGDCGINDTREGSFMRGAETAKGGELIPTSLMEVDQTGMKYLVEKCKLMLMYGIQTAFKEGADFTWLSGDQSVEFYSSPKARMRRLDNPAVIVMIEKALDELDKESTHPDAYKVRDALLLKHKDELHELAPLCRGIAPTGTIRSLTDPDNEDAIRPYMIGRFVGGPRDPLAYRKEMYERCVEYDDIFNWIAIYYAFGTRLPYLAELRPEMYPGLAGPIPTTVGRYVPIEGCKKDEELFVPEEQFEYDLNYIDGLPHYWENEETKWGRIAVFNVAIFNEKGEPPEQLNKIDYLVAACKAEAWRRLVCGKDWKR